MRALLLHQVQAGVGAGGPDHQQPGRTRQLHCRSANAAARTMDQHLLARLTAAALEKCAICRAIRHAHRRSLLEAHLLRQRMYLRLGA